MEIDAEKTLQTGQEPVTTEPGKHGPRLTKQYWFEALKAIIVYSLVIWIPTCWILGSTHHQKRYVKNMKIVVADLDQSGIGKSITGTSEVLSGTQNMPTFEMRPDITTHDAAYDEVWSGKYWGGIVIHAHATDHFVDAFMKGNTSYDPRSAVSVIYNSARWPATSQGYVIPVLPTIVQKSVPAFKEKFGIPLLQKYNGTATPEMFKVLFNPYDVTKEDIHPFKIGARYFLGTAAMVFPAILTFFVSLGTQKACQNWGYLRPIDGLIYRGLVGLVLTLIGGVFYPIWYTIFDEDTPLSSKEFLITWMVFWLYGQACFWFFDTAINTVNIAFLPPTVLTFIVIQVASSAFPHTIKQRFYKIDYIMPSFNTFELFVSVITHGSTCYAKRNIPVLFAWIIFWFCLNMMIHQSLLNKDLRAKGGR